MVITDTTELMLRLSAADGVSGCESEIYRVLERELGDLGRCSETALGNLICTVAPPSGGRHLMLAAHMDEIGLIVTHIGDDGFLKVANVGGIDRKLMTGACLKIHTRSGELDAVLCSTPPHLQKGDDKEIPTIDEMYVDTGLSGERAKELISLGDRITIDSESAVLIDGSVSAKALDDRVCCAAVILALRMLAEEGFEYSSGLSAVFTTMEETGLQGARTAANIVAPSHAVVLDVTFAKSPDVSDVRTGFIKKGPMIGVAPILSNGMTDCLIETARKRGIPYQIEVMNGATGTDADAIAVSGSGVHTAIISIPLRYMHTPIETVAPSDVQETAKLLAEYIRGFCGAAGGADDE